MQGYVRTLWRLHSRNNRRTTFQVKTPLCFHQWTQARKSILEHPSWQQTGCQRHTLLFGVGFWGSGFRVWFRAFSLPLSQDEPGFGVWVSRFKVQGFRAQGCPGLSDQCRQYGSELLYGSRVWGLGFGFFVPRVWGLGFRGGGGLTECKLRVTVQGHWSLDVCGSSSVSTRPPALG